MKKVPVTTTVNGKEKLDTIDEFEMVNEAIDKLGMERVLVLINYAYSLEQRSKIRMQMTRKGV